MMYCLRRYVPDLFSHIWPWLTCHSYIPLLLLPLPLSLSPLHLALLLALTYFLSRPCIYCSFLLVILFASSCHWSSRCFVDFSYKPAEEGGQGYANWFLPRLYGHHEVRDHANFTFADILGDVANSTASALSGVAFEIAKRNLTGSSGQVTKVLLDGTGLGVQWLRRLLGRHEWILPCVGIKIRL